MAKDIVKRLTFNFQSDSFENPGMYNYTLANNPLFYSCYLKTIVYSELPLVQLPEIRTPYKPFGIKDI